MHNTLLKSIAIVGMGLLLPQCTLDPECSWEDLYPEYETYTHYNDVEGTNLVLMGPEFDPSINVFTGYVIRTDSAYQDLIAFSQDEGCPDCNYPTINFAEWTLVGYPMEVSCLATNYLKMSSTPDGWRFAVKTVDETKCNSLLCNNFSFNWILLPKSADTTTINFEAGIARYFCDC
jgi:hypothetical protein